MQIVINVENEQDLNQLLPLLQKLQLKFTTKPSSPKKLTNRQKTKEKLLNLLDQGKVDVSYFGDPLTFQNQQREERERSF